MLKNVELRKLPAGSLCRITETLETNGDWKKVMSVIPKQLGEDSSGPKYNNEQMRLIEEYAKQTNRNCAEILFDEWGTSGRVRPTLGTLQEVVTKAGIYKAADEIALMLKEPLPSRPLEGPAAKINSDITELLNSSKSHKKRDPTMSTARMKSSSFIPKMLQSLGSRSTHPMKTDNNTTDSTAGLPSIPNFDILMKSEKGMKKIYPRPLIKIDSTILQNKTLIRFNYDELKEITSGFSDDFIQGPYGPTGKIGSGGFGDVFAGWHKQHGTLAVKKIRNLDAFNEKPDFIAHTFNSEVKFLSQLRHENIVPIIGYCMQMEARSFPSLCIVCEYIDGGSLEQKLQAGLLNEKQRLDITLGTARGLKYIHTTEIKDLSIGDDDNVVKFLHGDVKTANILLTRNYQPKLCDFGLAKQFNTTMMTESLMGTRPYMSPERIRGMITQKSDVYSFGIVLLELLTGLQCNVRYNSELINIKDYVRQKASDGDVKELLDQAAKPWSRGQAVYELAQKCLIDDYILRYSIVQVCDGLIRICEEVTAEAVDQVE